MSAAQIRDAARALNEARPGLSRGARQVFLGHVLNESYFGYAFKTPDGSPSHNWGAIYAPGDRGTIDVNDTNEGIPFVGKAAWNSSAVVGARQYVNLITNAYAPALAKATDGDAWGFAVALWRNGPGSSRPPYYGGFPPGHKWGAPKSVKQGSALDYWYRKKAFATAVRNGAATVAGALGEPLAVRLVVPPAPRGNVVSGSSGSGGGVIVATALTGAVWLGFRSLKS